MEIQPIYILIALIIGGLSSLVFKYTNDFFAKYDNNEIAITRNFLIIYTTLMFGVNLGLLVKYSISVIYYFLAFMLMYLSICAYIDYKTKMVYSILNVIAGAVGILFLAYSIFACNALERLDWISVAIFVIVMGICKIGSLFGDGDFDVFLVESFYICALPDVLFPIEKILFIMAMSVVTQFATNIKKIDFPHLRLKEPVALIPAIFLSTVINIFI